MGKIDGGPAFPRSRDIWPDPDNSALSDISPEQDGMSLRDWLAGQVIGTLLTEQVMLVEDLPETNFEYRSLAGRAYAVADAMLEARSVGGRRDEICGLCGNGVLVTAQDHAESLCGACRDACERTGGVLGG